MKSNLGYISCTQEPPQPMDYNDFSLDLGTVSVIRYADDTTIIACGKTSNEVQLKLQSSVDNALVWLNKNRLLVNISKST